jgi:hypothetical protein
MLIRVFILVSLINFCSCKTSNETKLIDYTGYTKKSLILVGYHKNHIQKDTLGITTLKLQWSDCGLPCALSNYRFADKNYSQISESGFYWTYHPDSLYQFTIQHDPIKATPDSIILNPLSQKDTSFVFHYLTLNLCVCEDYNFYCGHLTWKATVYLVGSTKLKDRYVHFMGECSAKDTTNFVNAMYKTLLSINIDEK